MLSKYVSAQIETISKTKAQFLPPSQKEDMEIRSIWYNANVQKILWEGGTEILCGTAFAWNGVSEDFAKITPYPLRLVNQH